MTVPEGRQHLGGACGNGNYRAVGIKVTLIAASFILLLVLTTGCKRTLNLGDPSLKRFASMYSVDRSRYGLTPIPKTGTVTVVECRSIEGSWDAMLSFEGNPSRQILFRWNGKMKMYQWVAEQEIFDGPRTWESPEGASHEAVTITLFKDPGEAPPERPAIEYDGPDEELMWSRLQRPNLSLTLAEVNPLLAKWGLRK